MFFIFSFRSLLSLRTVCLARAGWVGRAVLGNLLGLFTVFTSSIQVRERRTDHTIRSCLSDRFKMHSRGRCVRLCGTLHSVCSSSLFMLSGRRVIQGVYRRVGMGLETRRRLLLLVHFIRFTCAGDRRTSRRLTLFHLMTSVFSVPRRRFSSTLTFVAKRASLSLLAVDKRRRTRIGRVAQGKVRKFVHILCVHHFSGRVFACRKGKRMFVGSVPLSSSVFCT